MGKCITLAQDTLTLEFPCLQDLHAAVDKHDPADGVLTAELGYFKLGGKLTGLQLQRRPGSRALVDKLWHMNKPVVLVDGSIELPEHVSLLITCNVVLKNVTITGKGRAGQRHADPCLVHVAAGGTLTLDSCTIECEASDAHAVLATDGGKCTVMGTRMYGGGIGAALKVSGGTATVAKRSVIQGGILVTAPQPAANYAAQLAGVAATCATAAKHSQPSQTVRHSVGITPADADAAVQVSDAIAYPDQEQQVQCSGHGTNLGSTGAVQVSSHLEIRNSEVLAGSVACLTVHGSGSHVVCEQCTIGGATNFGVLATKGANVQLIKCDVGGTSTSGTTLCSGAQLHAEHTTMSAKLLGLRVNQGCYAQITRCKLSANLAPNGTPPPLPAPPKPGFLPHYRPVAGSPAEARGKRAVIAASDCVFGAPGVVGWRTLNGGQVSVQQGLEEAMMPLNSLTAVKVL